MAALARYGLARSACARCGETRRDGAQPGQGDCRWFVGVWLALAFGDRRRVELRTQPSSWHEPLRTSATAGEAPNARVQRGRERPHKQPREVGFAASAATPCYAT